MKTCHSCGYQMTDDASCCPNCGSESPPVGLSFEQIAFIACSALSMLSLILSWIRIDLWGVIDTSVTPFSLIGVANDLNSALSDYLPSELGQNIFVYALFVICLFFFHGLVAFLTYERKKSAYLCGMVANLCSFFFSITIYSWGSDLAYYTRDAISLGLGVYLALAASIVGLVLFVRLFGEQIHSIPDALGHLAAAAIALCVPFVTCLKSLGLV